MTTPAGGATNPGQADVSSPTTGGNQTYAASGAAGADAIDAPDNQYGSVHRPGQAPGVDVASGPAVMKVGSSDRKGKKNKKSS